uniref:LAGLIDADG endonuclease n=1 Tax=Coniothyrium glycines TaxID=1077358 RepID=A0A3G4S6I3_9PLEO|nr:LAGLIDADG endonuclease [Coniothyrium glycines]AYU74380.1 LAGLIDADG endonuclease [Coniothyrium glycines]
MVKRSLRIYIIQTFSLTNLKNKIIRLYSSNTSKSTRYNFNNTYNLNPYYITGLVDAEGCFTTSIYKDSRMKKGWQVKPIFKINLHKKDLKILEALQKTWGVGKIYRHSQDSLMYRVSSLKNLRIITNHFDNYPLITQKSADYLLFKQSIYLIQEKLHLTEKGLLTLVGIKSVLNRGLSEKFKETFPNRIPVVRPKVDISDIKDVYWLIGFVEGEGSFMVIIQESKSKITTENIALRFVITQHSKDSLLLENISNYLGCGKCYFSRNEVNLTVSTISDINDKIISLFNKYPLLGTKKEDYLDFCKVAELMKSKDHLKKEGIENIKRIRINMNSKRIY